MKRSVKQKREKTKIMIYYVYVGCNRQNLNFFMIVVYMPIRSNEESDRIRENLKREIYEILDEIGNKL